MKHRRQKLVALACLGALLFLSWACFVPPPPPRTRPLPLPPIADGDAGSPLSHPDRQFPVQSAAVNAVAFDPTGRWMATAGEDRVVTVWNFQEKRIALQLRGHLTGITSVTFSPDGKTIASGDEDGTLRVWDARTGGLHRSWTAHAGDIRSVAYSPDGTLLATAGNDRIVKLWDATSGSLAKTLTGHSAAVNCISFSPNGKTIASASADDTVRLWDVHTGGLFQTLSGHSDPVTSVQFSPDGQLVASASASVAALSHHGELKFWNTATGREIPSPVAHFAVTSLVFRPDGKAIALAYYGSDGPWNIQVLDLGGAQTLRHYVAHSRRIAQLAYSPDGSWLVSVAVDRFIRAWHQPL